MHLSALAALRRDREQVLSTHFFRMLKKCPYFSSHVCKHLWCSFDLKEPPDENETGQKSSGWIYLNLKKPLVCVHAKFNDKRTTFDSFHVVYF
jgi:hypothetical protein